MHLRAQVTSASGRRRAWHSSLWYESEDQQLVDLYGIVAVCWPVSSPLTGKELQGTTNLIESPLTSDEGTVTARRDERASMLPRRASGNFISIRAELKRDFEQAAIL